MVKLVHPDLECEKRDIIVPTRKKKREDKSLL